MEETRWPSFDLIFFDCDSTLSAIEGIDELARFKGKELRVGVLTEKAMNGDLDLSEVYGKRLQAIRPTRGQLKAIEERYWETIVPDAEAVIAALHYLCVGSAGDWAFRRRMCGRLNWNTTNCPATGGAITNRRRGIDRLTWITTKGH
jgi:phosphoserine phosphatase